MVTFMLVTYTDIYPERRHPSQIEEYTREATSRCYNHLLFTTITWVETR